MYNECEIKFDNFSTIYIVCCYIVCSEVSLLIVLIIVYFALYHFRVFWLLRITKQRQMCSRISFFYMYFYALVRFFIKMLGVKMTK